MNVVLVCRLMKEKIKKLLNQQLALHGQATNAKQVANQRVLFSLIRLFFIIEQVSVTKVYR